MNKLTPKEAVILIGLYRAGEEGTYIGALQKYARECDCPISRAGISKFLKKLISEDMLTEGQLVPSNKGPARNVYRLKDRPHIRQKIDEWLKGELAMLTNLDNLE